MLKPVLTELTSGSTETWTDKIRVVTTDHIDQPTSGRCFPRQDNVPLYSQSSPALTKIHRPATSVLHQPSGSCHQKLSLLSHRGCYLAKEELKEITQIHTNKIITQPLARILNFSTTAQPKTQRCPKYASPEFEL